VKVNNLIHISEYKDIEDSAVYFLSEESCSLGDSEIEKARINLYKNKEFNGNLSEIISFKIINEKKINSIIFVGTGNKNMIDSYELIEAIENIIKKARSMKSKRLDFHIPIIDNKEKLKDIIRIISEKTITNNYDFDKYKSKKEHKLMEVNIVIRNKIDVELDEKLKEGNILAKSNILTRNMVNEPANILYPQELSRRVKKYGEEYGFEVEVLNEKQIKSLNMNAYLSVAQGSDKKPRFIIMRYLNNKESSNILGLVGKGVTYDSGGLSIKNSESMLNSKYDMAGAAAVVGTMRAVAEMNLKVNVIAVVAACESMVSGKSYKPGDIIYTMSGKSVYIENADAEGRLTLADAINYILEKEEVNQILDIATLTGAVVKILGSSATGVVSNNSEFYKKLENASYKSGEKIWRLPIFKEYRKTLKTDDADLTNRSGDPSTITAALFIEEFVQKKPWIHMDIAGTALYSKGSLYGNGSTGVGVSSMYYLIKNLNS